MRRNKRICAILAALMLLGVTACGKPAAETQNDPTRRDDGKVYVERKIAMDIQSGDIGSMMMLPGGNFMATSIKYNDNGTSSITMHVMDTDGKVLSTSEVDMSSISAGIGNLTLGLDGKIYALETRYDTSNTDKPGDAMPQPEPLVEPRGTDDEATPTEAGATPTGAEATPSEVEATPTDAEEEAASSKAAVQAATPAPAGGRVMPVEEGEYVRKSPEMFVHTFDETGKLIKSVQLIMPADDANMEMYIGGMQVDEQGRVYAMLGGREIRRFSPQGAFDKAFEYENINTFVLLPEGEAMVTGYSESGEYITRADLDKGETRFSVTGNNYFERIVYNPRDRKVYGKASTVIKRFEDDGTTKDVLYMSDFSLVSPILGVRDFAFGEEEKIFFVVSKNMSSFEQMKFEIERQKANGELPYPQMPCELVVLELQEESSVPKRTEITVSVMYQDYTMMQAASMFQELRPDIAVKVREIVPMDSMDRSQEDAWELYTKRVNTEILSGKAADIIALANLPYQQYQDKNILLNIGDLIKNDPDFTDENYYMNIIRAYEVNGKLFVLPRQFYASYLSTKPDWNVNPAGYNLREFIAFCDALPEDKAVLNYGTMESLFNLLFMENINYFLDTQNKTSRLDSQEFIDLLDACKRLGGRGMQPPIGKDDEQEWQRYNQYISENAVFQNNTLYDYRSMTSGAVMIPIPGMDGPSTAFNNYELYGINRSTKNKEASWAFLKFLVSEDFYKYTTYGNLTLNKKVNKIAADYQIELDSLGDYSYLKDMPTTDPSYWQMYRPLTQAVVDQVNEKAARLDNPVIYDNKLMNMIMEEVTNFFEGKKDARATSEALQSRMSMYLSE